MPRKKQAHLLVTMAYVRAKSFTTAMTALRFIVDYCMVCDRLDDRVPIERFAEEIGVSRSQAFRRQAAFRTCFPEDDVLAMWEWIKPPLMASSFRNEPSFAQAVYIGTLKTTFESS